MAVPLLVIMKGIKILNLFNFMGKCTNIFGGKPFSGRLLLFNPCVCGKYQYGMRNSITKKPKF